MGRHTYRLTESVAQFPEGEILEVTARFGDWAMHDMELSPRSKTSSAPKLRVTDTRAGFSEADILDPTARLGDWHERALTFDPAGGDDEYEIAMDDFESVAEPIDASA